jgi:hypothetical protein
MNMDEADVVAVNILNAMRKHRKEAYIGFPESAFVRINSILPGLVDRAVGKQNRIARKHAESAG